MTALQQIPQIFAQLAKTSSSNEKKKILAENKLDEIAFIFKQAYDVFITFGTVKIDLTNLNSYEKAVDAAWFSKLSALLADLKNRKLTGNAARDTIFKFLNNSPREWSEIILNILKKDLRIGVSMGIINKVYPGLLPEAICMGAMKFDEKRVSFPVYADSKLDGIRCIATVGDVISGSHAVSLISRNGKAFKNYPFIAEELKQLNVMEGWKLDGEITMGHFQDLMRTISRKEDGIDLAKDAVYNIFDLQFPDASFEGRLHTLQNIQASISRKKLSHLKIVSGRIVQNMQELMTFYEAQLHAGFEGVIVKSLDGLYEYKRSYNWMKLKPEETEDLKIIDFEEGSGKYQNQLGAFICELSNGGEVRVGSGLTDSERKEFWEKRNDLLGQTIEIKFQEKTKDDSLRFPVFLRFRTDK